MKKKNQPNVLEQISKSYAKTGVALGISGAIVGRASTLAPQVAPLSTGISTIASFAPIAGTTMIGGSLIKQTKKLKKRF